MVRVCDYNLFMLKYHGSDKNAGSFVFGYMQCTYNVIIFCVCLTIVAKVM